MNAPAAASRGWITGKAIPLIFWGVLLVLGVWGIPGAISHIGEGASLASALELGRRLLTLAFIATVGSTYITRIRAADRARGARETLFPMFVFLAGIVGVWVLMFFKAPPRPSLVLAGLALACLGICGSLWALAHLRNSFSILAEARRVVSTGPYRFVRHPLYLGEAVTMFGLCLSLGTIWALLFWASINALQIFRARIEEEKLAREFPDYRLYREKTSFILPGIY
jgi:protein-S-isoprenylcysteine O-methyltransferase Ste14